MEAETTRKTFATYDFLCLSRTPHNTAIVATLTVHRIQEQTPLRFLVLAIRFMH